MSCRIGEREPADDDCAREVRADQQEPAGVTVGEEPPIRSVVTSPSASTDNTMPSELALPVSVNARQPSATMNAASPICDTV